MRKILIINILILIINSCNGQNKSNNILKKDTMDYFNEEKYKTLPINPKTGLKILENGNEIKYFKGSNNTDFVINIEEKNTPKTLVFVYHERTKSLKVIGQRFYGMIYGVWKEYDESGKLIKETNYEKDYKFSMDDLIKKMMDEYKIDILNTKETRSVSRFEGKYKVICNQRAEVIFDEYEINGTTGETLSIKTVNGDTEQEQIIFKKK